MWLATLTIDALNPGRLATFWAELLGADTVPGADDGEVLLRVPGSTTTMLFMPVAEPTPGRNRCHPDLHTSDLDADVARAEALGARVLERHRETSTWVVMADPEGNEFCLVSRPGDVPPPPYAGDGVAR